MVKKRLGVGMVTHGSLWWPLISSLTFAYVQNRQGWHRLHGMFLAPKMLARSCLIHKELQAFHGRMHMLGAGGEFSRPANPMGMVAWPYMNWRWPWRQRFAAVLGHYEVTHRFPGWLKLPYAGSVDLADLSAHSPGTSLVLDRAPWFMSEGEYVLNVFVDNLRAMSVAFSYSEEHGQRLIRVGAFQGVHSGVPVKTRLAVLKRLTKDFESLRPRSLLMHALRRFARLTGAQVILCVANENRMHHHPYFGKSHQALTASANYDEIWEEHGGVRRPDGFYELAVNVPPRDLAEVPSRKRAQYRRRQQILDDVEDLLAQAFTANGRVHGAA